MEKASTHFIFGASSGIGKATATLLKKNGSSVTTFSRRKIDNSCDNNFQFDVKQPFEATSVILDKALNNNYFGGLVYSVTEKFPKADLLSYNEKDFFDSIKASTIGLHNVLKWVSMLDLHFFDLKLMPSIVVLSSNSASSVSPYSGFLYSHSKASQLSLCRYYAEYFDAIKRCRLNVLTPGLVNTELSQLILGKEFLKTQEYIESSDVAILIEHLLSNESSDIRNQQIFISHNKTLNYRHLFIK